MPAPAIAPAPPARAMPAAIQRRRAELEANIAAAGGSDTFAKSHPEGYDPTIERPESLTVAVVEDRPEPINAVSTPALDLRFNDDGTVSEDSFLAADLPPGAGQEPPVRENVPSLAVVRETETQAAAPEAAPVTHESPALTLDPFEAFSSSFGQTPETPVDAQVTPESPNPVLEEVRALAAQVSAIAAAREAAATPAAPQRAVPAPVPYEELTEQERADYESHIPVFNKIAGQAISKVAQDMYDRMAPEIEALRAENSTLRAEFGQSVSSMATTGFKQALTSAVPDLGSLAAHGQFKEFMKQPIPYAGGETVYDRLDAAYKQANVPVVRAIMDDFRRLTSRTPAVAAPAIGAFESPSSVPSAAPPLDTGAPRKPANLPWSKRQQAAKLWMNGKLSQKEFDGVKNLYDKAQVENRIDFTR